MEREAVEILLVEDNPADVELTLRALKKHNLANKVYTVKDGEEALDYVFCKGKYADINGIPKLVLLDLKLPKVSGLEVLREMKSNETTKIIPVVVLTSSKEEKDMVESYKLGVNSYIQKPVDFDKFLSTVSELGLYWLLLNKLPER
ncbi:MAG: response regulator [Candidatus Omnitrophota bacterium]